jgi:hypothetical protein
MNLFQKLRVRKLIVYMIPPVLPKVSCAVTPKKALVREKAEREKAAKCLPARRRSCRLARRKGTVSLPEATVEDAQEDLLLAEAEVAALAET